MEIFWVTTLVAQLTNIRTKTHPSKSDFLLNYLYILGFRPFL